MMIADDTLKLSLDNNKKKTLKSHLMNSLLFEDRILLSDSQIIGNRNFRKLIRDNDELINCLTPENFSIGIRDSIDIRTETAGSPQIIEKPNIIEVLQGFISWDKCKWTSSSNDTLTKENYQKLFDIQYIEGKAKLERYSLGDASATYADDVLRLFDSEIIKQRIGKELCDLIHTIAREWRESHKSYRYPKSGLGMAFFLNDLPTMLKKRHKKNLWKQYQKEIIDIAQASYLTTLPKILNCNIIYGSMHKDKIEISRGLLAKIERIDDDIFYDSWLRLLDFEEGISRLKADDIAKLRESTEYKEYRKKINQFNGSEKALKEVKESLFQYKSLIDELIITKFPCFRSPRKEKREKFQSLAILSGLSTYGGLFLSGLALATSFTGMNLMALGLGITSFFTSPRDQKEDIKERRLIETDKQRIIEELNKSNSQKIEAEVSVLTGNQFSKEVFFKSIT
ncbi:hypothetical protein [Moorena sp. SIO3H5]|uniref:hypothetical protein n=1 Tax=Moorena sp. SIO3H5 TaxID=2607834 RepID=UPI0013BCB1FA|nr:hypothetical protein [Moorena sp. SIO3H5]NEO71730.1 hypothetical protein [Moorena sp. SIO3H5]